MTASYTLNLNPTPNPNPNRWFLESLLERQRPEGTVYWLRQITLECLDNMARHTATRLIAHACCCGANDPTERELLTAVDRTTGRALNRWGKSRGKQHFDIRFFSSF